LSDLQAEKNYPKSTREIWRLPKDKITRESIERHHHSGQKPEEDQVIFDESRRYPKEDREG
jgi:hypothetical protein